jgi:hypothetical protein
MTLAAERWYLHRGGLAYVTATRSLCSLFVHLCRIATMAVGTRESAHFVDVVIEQLSRFGQSFVSQPRMTFDA